MYKTSTDTQELRKLLHALLPPVNNYIPVVKKEQQQTQLNILNEIMDDESFYFVFNLLTCEIEQVKGVDTLLGYSGKEFTVDRYLNCIVHDQSLQFKLIAYNMYQLLCRGVFKLQFSTQRYISLLGLKHYNGDAISFKKTTSVFQYDENNRLLAQLNVFSKIGAYEGTPLYLRTTEMNGLQKEKFEQQVFQMTMKSFMDNKYFSTKEFEALKHYAHNETISSRELASLLNIAETTMDTYNKRILGKARKTFTHSFSSAKEVASYLKKEKIL